MTDFNGLGLAAPLLKALAAKGYGEPTPIQFQAIPPVLAGRDLIGLAQTGTGKTAAFALPILHRLAASPKRASRCGARALVLAPTRELAGQIAESFRAYAKFLKLSTACIYGGAPFGKQIAALAPGVDVLVATPGRLLDLVERRACRLDEVDILVLDEADHMLDLGFIHALKRIARLLPKTRQTLFFSATMPPPIEALASDFLIDPARVAAAPAASTAERVEQGVIHVEQANKQTVLVELLRRPELKRAIVFSRTKHGADRIVRRLEDDEIEAVVIHGNKKQSQRERALAAFKRGQVFVLVATEIAARGIDISGVSHVINFDLPDVPEQYVHRIGRTARAGAEGSAISFCAPDERGALRDIERVLRQSVPVLDHPLALPTPDPAARVQPRKRPQRQARSSPAKPHGRPQAKPQAHGRPVTGSPQRAKRRFARD